MMIDPVTGGPHTAHTTNPVPFIVVSGECEAVHAEAEWLAARYFADDSRNARTCRAERNDGAGFASRHPEELSATPRVAGAPLVAVVDKERSVRSTAAGVGASEGQIPRCARNDKR